jgi:cytochrome P450
MCHTSDPSQKIHTQGNQLEFAAFPEFTDEDIAAQALTFFTDGYETSSTALAVLIYDLARNPDVQKRLRKEVDSVTAQHNGQLDMDIIQAMEYLDMVVQGNLKFRYFLRTDLDINPLTPNDL